MRYALAAALLLVVVLAGLWDIWVISMGRQADTVSAVLHQWSLQFPILPLIVGLLLGHIFWPSPGIDHGAVK